MEKQWQDWNLFACELEEILRAHHQSLNALDPRLGITEAKARRLRQSMRAPIALPVLSLDELYALEEKLPLSSEEWARLQAALLATAIERMLVGCIKHERAVQIAESVIPLLCAALQEQHQAEKGQRERRGPDGEALKNTKSDRLWEEIWGILDAAALALQLGDAISSERERLKKFREARADFQEALDLLDLLDHLDRGAKALPIWTEAYQEGHRGLEAAADLLSELGKAP